MLDGVILLILSRIVIQPRAHKDAFFAITLALPSIALRILVVYNNWMSFRFLGRYLCSDKPFKPFLNSREGFLKK